MVEELSFFQKRKFSIMAIFKMDKEVDLEDNSIMKRMFSQNMIQIVKKQKF